MSDSPEPAAQPDWIGRAITLHDHFDAYTTLRVAQPQPQYGTVQLNATFKGTLISVDVNLADLLAALHAVTATPLADLAARFEVPTEPPASENTHD
jgi:hypothetical protein